MKEININASGFVIPNKARRIGDFFEESKRDLLKEFCELNNIKSSEDTKFVELWLTNESELKSINLADHGFKFILNGVERMLFPVSIRWIPYELIKDCKENDVLDFKFPYYHFEKLQGRKINKIDISKNEEPIDEFMIFNVRLTCKQQGFRYQDFGKFEDVVKMVMIIE